MKLSAKMKKLLKDKENVRKEMDSLVKKADSENRDLTPEERTTFESHEAEINTINSRVSTERRMLELDSEISEDFGEGDGDEDVDPADEADEDEGEKEPEHRTGGRRGDGSKENRNRFGSLGEFLQSVYLASDPSAPNRRMDPRLKMEKRTASGINEANPSDGGFLVQQDFSSELLKNAWDYGQLLSRVKVSPISQKSNSMKFLTVDETSRVNGSRHGGVQIYWSAEAETKAASKPKWGSQELNLHKLLAFCYATEEQLEDTVNLEAEISEAFRDEFSFVLDDVILSGNGAGKPLGILNSDALVTVSKESMQDAGTINFQNVLKMYARMLPRSISNAVWFYNQQAIVQLAQMSMTIGDAGVPVFMPAGGVSGSPFPTLFGRPLIPIEQASAVGTIGDLIFADLSQYRMINKGGLKSSSSLHVRFLYDEQVFKFTYRCDGKPKMRKSITPYKGSDTISPFIALETR